MPAGSRKVGTRDMEETETGRARCADRAGWRLLFWYSSETLICR